MSDFNIVFSNMLMTWLQKAFHKRIIHVIETGYMKLAMALQGMHKGDYKLIVNLQKKRKRVICNAKLAVIPAV